MTSRRTLGLVGLFSVFFLGQIGCAPDMPGNVVGAGRAGGVGGAAGPAGSGGSGQAGNGQDAGSGSGGTAGDGGPAGNGGLGGAAGASAGRGGSGGAGPRGGTGGDMATAGTGGHGGVGGDTATGGAGAGGGGGRAGGAATGGAGGRGGGTGGVATGGAAGGAAGTGGMGGTTGPPVPIDPTLLSKCTGTNPIRCTIPVPANGNYNVAVELGSAAAASTSRILAELARLETQSVTLAAGQFSTQTFSVNVRNEVHDDYSAPGMVLDIVVDGSAPALHGLGFVSTPAIPTVFVAGDSTSCDWDPVFVTNAGHPLERGWAQEFSQYLLPGIAVADYADSGDTAGSLYGKFASRGAKMKRGDFLFIQFGHNDQKSQSTIDSFKSNLMKFITDARAAEATPILFTPVARKSATTADPGFAGLDDQVRQLAASQNVALVDLTSLAIAYYSSLTSAQLNATFFSTTEGTHFSESGATQIAGIVAKNLKSSAMSIRDLLK